MVTLELKSRVIDFMDSDPSEEQIEQFYTREVLPYTKDSITDIIETPLYEELMQWDKDDLAQCILRMLGER